jgi:hypothetical protein
MPQIDIAEVPVDARAGCPLPRHTDGDRRLLHIHAR